MYANHIIIIYLFYRNYNNKLFKFVIMGKLNNY